MGRCNKFKKKLVKRGTYLSGAQVVIIVDQETLEFLLSHLAYKYKQLGRVVCKRLPALGLKAGDRLEPSVELPDIAKLKRTSPIPIQLTFWTASIKHARLLHESPVFDIPGVTVESWCVDILHGWHRGPLSAYVAFSLHFLVDSTLFDPLSKNMDADLRHRLALLHIKSEVKIYYSEMRQDEDWRKKGSEDA